MVNAMFVGFRDNQLYVYHYTSTRVLLDHILPTNQLKAGRYINTNDPKESKSWSFNIGTNQERDLKVYSLELLSEEMTNGMKNRTNVICFSADRTLTGNHIKDIHNRGFCRTRMWAQYADNHKGVCLIFNRNKIHRSVLATFPNYPIYWGTVTYVNRGIIPNLQTSPYVINIDYLEDKGKDEYLKAHIHTHHKRLFFEKAEDWRDEVEYRWVILGNEEKHMFVDFQDALSGVLFGASCSEEDIRSVVELCKEQGRTPWFEQLIWKGCAPWMSWRLQWP